MGLITRYMSIIVFIIVFPLIGSVLTTSILSVDDAVHHQSLYLEGSGDANNSPPLVKIIAPTWNEEINEMFELIVKIYDPDGIASASFGVPGVFMVPLQPSDPFAVIYPGGIYNTTLYTGGYWIDSFFEIYSERAGRQVNQITLTLIAEDTLGAKTTINLTVTRPDHKHPSVIIIFPRNGEHYIKGEEFRFLGGIPNFYWPCDLSNVPDSVTGTPTPCELLNMANQTIMNWTIIIALDNNQLVRESGSQPYSPGRNWPWRPKVLPLINTMDLQPGMHNLTYIMSIEMPVPGSTDVIHDTLRRTSIFYVDDPGEPAAYMVMDRFNYSLELRDPNITIEAHHITDKTKLWVYNDVQVPGSSPPGYVLMGPILLVVNNTEGTGGFGIHFHIDPERLRELGLNLKDLMPLVWDRDLDVWYPKGFYRIDPESYTITLWTTYPSITEHPDLGGGLYVALVSKTMPTTSPTVTILSPQPGATIKNENITVRWKVQKGSADIDKITLIIDGTQTVNLPPTATSYSLNLQPGTHEIIVKVVDVASRYSTDSITVTVTNTSQGQQRETPSNGNGALKTLVAIGVLAMAAISLFAVFKLGLFGAR
ncbi:MAG: Ig-like domain-containing protein [Desulfurococcales archaeon]|nr:Ig-like domain-containing protein [Desulfurococcales archaeon]